VTMTSAVFWDVTACNSVEVPQCFRGTSMFRIEESAKQTTISLLRLTPAGLLSTTNLQKIGVDT
jgi:hypothetical protein